MGYPAPVETIDYGRLAETYERAGLPAQAWILNRRRPSLEWARMRLEAFRERAKTKPLPSFSEYLEHYYVPLVGAADFFNVVLDTTAPAGVSITIAGGAAFTSTQSVTAAIATSDSPTTGYTMKIWGDVDNTFNTDIQTTEAASNWITFSTSQSLKLSTGNALKTINVKVRDDVLNISSQQSDTITLDTAVPVITIQAGSPSATKISTQTGADTDTIVWQSSVALQAYRVELVANGTSAHGTGTLIPVTGGSSNTSGTTVAATTNVTTVIKGADLQTAAGGPGNDGTKVLRIFGQASAGSQNWSA